ncbi:MAG: hypothetical protein KGH71_02770 [Candidatus Micrarchaeota archaeon]|nr:hypothetical protein [Candidatus Micrarchaeota archaeon]
MSQAHKNIVFNAYEFERYKPLGKFLHDEVKNENYSVKFALSEYTKLQSLRMASFEIRPNFSNEIYSIHVRNSPDLDNISFSVSPPFQRSEDVSTTLYELGFSRKFGITCSDIFRLSSENPTKGLNLSVSIILDYFISDLRTRKVAQGEDVNEIIFFTTRLHSIKSAIDATEIRNLMKELKK